MMKKLSRIINNLKQEVRQARARLETTANAITEDRCKRTIRHSSELIIKLEAAKREIEKEMSCPTN